MAMLRERPTQYACPMTQESAKVGGRCTSLFQIAQWRPYRLESRVCRLVERWHFFALELNVNLACGHPNDSLASHQHNPSV